MAARTLLVALDGTLTDNFAGISRSIRHALAALGAPGELAAALDRLDDDRAAAARRGDLGLE